jgi:hypothetical protein
VKTRLRFFRKSLSFPFIGTILAQAVLGKDAGLMNLKYADKVRSKAM